VIDSSLLSILGSIIQSYASILGIVGMYMIFLKQRKDEKVKELSTRLKIKADSMLDFINREIAPAYRDTPLIRADTENADEAIEAIGQYESDRRKEIPDVSRDDVRRLLVLWAIVGREKEALLQINNEFKQSRASTTSGKYFFPFVVFFTFELAFSFLGIFFVFIEHQYQYAITATSIGLAMLGVIPLANLIFRLR